jgi:hypothetical protein
MWIATRAPAGCPRAQARGQRRAAVAQAGLQRFSFSLNRRKTPQVIDLSNFEPNKSINFF